MTTPYTNKKFAAKAPTDPELKALTEAKKASFDAGFTNIYTRLIELEKLYGKTCMPGMTELDFARYAIAKDKLADEVNDSIEQSDKELPEELHTTLQAYENVPRPIWQEEILGSLDEVIGRTDLDSKIRVHELALEMEKNKDAIKEAAPSPWNIFAKIFSAFFGKSGTLKALEEKGAKLKREHDSLLYKIDQTELPGDRDLNAACQAAYNLAQQKVPEEHRNLVATLLEADKGEDAIVDISIQNKGIAQPSFPPSPSTDSRVVVADQAEEEKVQQHGM